MIGKRLALPLWLMFALLLSACATTTSYTPEPGETPGTSGTPIPERPPVIGRFDDALYICRGMTPSNAPSSDETRRITAYTPLINVDDVILASAPAPGACLSSGFGYRAGKLHKGIDLTANPGVAVLAAGNGKVLEKTFRADYGNMIVISHGHGVYTRYAHLASFDPAIDIGVKVVAGQRLGQMGNTAEPPVALHLHYEILTGDYNTPKQSFGLTAVSPFAYPPADE